MRLFSSDLRRACIDVLPRDQGALGQRPGPQRPIVVVVVAGWARVPQDSAAAAPPLGRHVLLGRSLLVRFSVRAISNFMSISITFLKLARLWALSHHRHSTTPSFARLLVSRLRPCHRQSISASLKEGDRSGGSAASWHDCGPSETRDAVLRVHNIVFSQVQRPNYHD